MLSRIELRKVEADDKAQNPEESKKRRRDRGGDGISWDKANKFYTGTISLGYRPDGKRDRRTVRGRTKAQVKDRLEMLHEEIEAGVRVQAHLGPGGPR